MVPSAGQLLAGYSLAAHLKPVDAGYVILLYLWLMVRIQQGLAMLACARRCSAGLVQCVLGRY